MRYALKCINIARGNVYYAVPKWFDGENKVLNHEQACDYRREVTKRMANAGWIENEDYTCEIVEMDDDFDFDNQPVFDNQPEFN